MKDTTLIITPGRAATFTFRSPTTEQMPVGFEARVDGFDPIMGFFTWNRQGLIWAMSSNLTRMFHAASVYQFHVHAVFRDGSKAVIFSGKLVGHLEYERRKAAKDDERVVVTDNPWV